MSKIFWILPSEKARFTQFLYSLSPNLLNKTKNTNDVPLGSLSPRFPKIFIALFPLVFVCSPAVQEVRSQDWVYSLDVPQQLNNTWGHDNGSDQWDGSETVGEIGEGNAPYPTRRTCLSPET